MGAIRLLCFRISHCFVVRTFDIW